MGDRRYNRLHRWWVSRTLICLVLGAITTVAVAWWCAQGDLMGRALVNGTASVSGGVVWTVDRRTTRWMTQIQVLQSSDPRVGAAARSRTFQMESASLWDRWARRPIGVEQLSGSAIRKDRVWGFGWPVRTMSFREYFLYDNLPSPAPRSIVGGLLVRPNENQWDYTRPHALPLTPIWFGFLLSTLMFAALWILPLNWPALRREVRRRSGRCPACGYDLRHDLAAGCPECGWNREDEETERPPESDGETK